MQPYWQANGITIYHCRAEEMLPLVRGAVVITDPPYNCGVNYGEGVDDRRTWPDWCLWWDGILELCDHAAPDVLAFMSQTAYRKYLRLGKYEPDWCLAWVKPMSMAVCALPFMPHWEPIPYWGTTRKKDGAFWGGDVLTCNVTRSDAIYTEVPTCNCIQPGRGTCAVDTKTGCECITISFGKNNEDQSLAAIKCITQMETSKITESRTWRSLTPVPTSDCTMDANGATACGGKCAPTAEHPNPSQQSSGIIDLEVGQHSNTVNRVRSNWRYGISKCGVCARPYRRLSHPTVKPLALMRDLVARFDGPIVDPFMGSGTTLRAARDQGKVAIGCDCIEAWCELAARRMEQFSEEPPEQQRMALVGLEKRKS